MLLNPIGTLLSDLRKSFIGIPWISWIALLFGLSGLFLAASHPEQNANVCSPPSSERPVGPSQSSPSTPANPVTSDSPTKSAGSKAPAGPPAPAPATSAAPPAPAPATSAAPAAPAVAATSSRLQRLKDLPWWQLVREISVAAVVSFFLAFFLEAPLREHTITSLGRDVAPFLISALTIPEMRYKMRQICEFAVVRKNCQMHLWIDPVIGDEVKITVQMRSNFCNISNSAKKVNARVVVDQEYKGEILGLSIRPINIQGIDEHHWSYETDPKPTPVEGESVIEKEFQFPSTDDWEHSYVEVTGKYSELVPLVAGIGKTIFKSAWPMMGVEIECVTLPPDVHLQLTFPSGTAKKVPHANRWISDLAMLPGERIDIKVIRDA